MWLSLVERLVRDQEVGCSNHLTPTTHKVKFVKYGLTLFFFAEKLKLYGKIKIRILEGEDNMIEFKFLGEKEFYNEFLTEIIDVLCGKYYDKNNAQHVSWLKRYIANLYLADGKAICLYENSQPAGFIFVLHDKGLENADCFGKKANIAMFEVKEQYRSKGYGKLLIRKAEEFLKKEGAECLYTDTTDNPFDRGALTFYVKNGYTPVGYHPCENGKDGMAQIYLFKYL